MRFDGYIRVSRVAGRAGESFISPAVQRDQIDTWARLRNVEIAAWHEDLDQSGGKLNRPGLEAMLARLDAGETEGVAVAKLDRLSRLGVADALTLVERITSAGGTLAAVDLGLDPTTPFGEFGTTILLAMGRMERRRIADAWSVAQARAIERGVKVSRTPFGYDRNNTGRLVPNADAQHVRRAYELAAHDVAAASRYLADHAQGFWTTATTRRLLARRTYLGEAIYGDQANLAAHEPLVTRTAWEAAQHTPRGRRASQDYPLSGLPVCGTCGGPMAGGNRTGSGKRTYRCSAGQTLHRGIRCPQPAAIIADRLEAHARTLLEPLFRGRRVRVVGDQATVDVETAMLDAERELDEFAADLTARRLLGDRYHEHLRTRAEAVQRAQAAFREAARGAGALEQLTGEDALADPAMIAVALRNLRLTLRVMPGRGTVEDRVTLVAVDDETLPREG